jgi:hypothetical protein
LSIEEQTRQVAKETITMAFNRLYFTTLQFIGILLFVWSSPTLGAELTVDQKLQLLKENLVRKKRFDYFEYDNTF